MRILVVNYHPVFHLGGSEIQTDLLSSEWVKQGHHVVYAVLGTSQSPENTNYHVIPVPHEPGAIIEVIESQQPEVVYWRSGFRSAAIVSSYCRLSGISFVFSACAVQHVEPWGLLPDPPEHPVVRALKTLRSVRTRLKKRVDFEFYRVFSGVVMATNVLEQRLPSRFDIPTTVIYDSMVPRNLDAFEWPKPFILWVANLKRTKRPERLLPLAKPLEEKGVDILMVGAIQQTYYEDFVQALPSNVHYLGARSLQDVDEMMSAARIFVHTCEPEGFGNNFIQAWQQGVPTISFEFDPDGLIEEYQTGVVAHGSERDFVSSVLELVSDEQRAKSLGENGRQMAADLCDIRANAERFIDFFELVLAQKH